VLPPGSPQPARRSGRSGARVLLRRPRIHRRIAGPGPEGARRELTPSHPFPERPEQPLQPAGHRPAQPGKRPTCRGRQRRWCTCGQRIARASRSGTEGLAAAVIPPTSEVGPFGGHGGACRGRPIAAQQLDPDAPAQALKPLVEAHGRRLGVLEGAGVAGRRPRWSSKRTRAAARSPLAPVGRPPSMTGTSNGSYPAGTCSSRTPTMSPSVAGRGRTTPAAQG
jgi:hypothetical protein